MTVAGSFVAKPSALLGAHRLVHTSPSYLDGTQSEYLRRHAEFMGPYAEEYLAQFGELPQGGLADNARLAVGLVALTTIAGGLVGYGLARTRGTRPLGRRRRVLTTTLGALGGLTVGAIVAKLTLDRPIPT